MTIAAAGALGFSDILDELDLGSHPAKAMSASDVRWLAEDTSGAIAFSSFYSQPACKLIDTAGDNTQGSTFSATMSFGTAFTGRELAIVIFAYNESGDFVTATCTVGGAAVSLTQASESGASGAFAAIGLLNTTATSGAVAISFSNQVARIYVAIVQMVNFSTTVDSFSLNGQASSGSTSITAGSNGLVLHALTRKYDAADDVELTGTELMDSVQYSNMLMSLAFFNRQSAGSKACAWSGGAASQRYAWVGRSWT